MPANAPAPPTHANDHLTAKISLRDGRELTVPLTVAAARPSIALLSKSAAPVAGSIVELSNPDDLALTSSLTFTLKSPNPFPRNGQIEIETLDGTLRTVLTLAPSGGLLLQDPHTIVATLDPLRSFGPSAFGALHLRAVFPATDPKKPVEKPSTTTVPAAVSDWLPLVTLVRLPTFTQLQCPADATQPCTLTGGSLFLLEALSIDPAFANQVAVPDGYTGTSLTLPHPSAETVFFKLRDDPTAVDSAIFPAPPAATARAHRATTATAPANAPVKQESPAPTALGFPTGPSRNR
jgi:hypothetical protein